MHSRRAVPHGPYQPSLRRAATLRHRDGARGDATATLAVVGRISYITPFSRHRDLARATWRAFEQEPFRLVVTARAHRASGRCSAGRDRLIRCGINVEIPRRPTLHAEHRAETERLAFDGAFEALARRIARARGRMLDERRRPKKYFAAKRLLSA